MNTISNLLALASSRPPSRTRTLVRSLVESAVEACLLPAGVSVELSILQDLAGNLDPNQARHVLVNLLTNASQALRGRGRIWVAAEARSGALELRVRDDGPGIPESVRHRIFEPLFTTKAQGSGLGLAIVRKIVDAHEGRIDMTTADGRGTKFRVTLPVEPLKKK